MPLPDIQHYMEYLFRAALKKCGNLDDAKDLTQEVLLAALQYPKEITEIKSWLCMVLNHKYYDLLRRKYKLPMVSFDLIPEEAEPWVTQEADDRPDAIWIGLTSAVMAVKDSLTNLGRWWLTI